MRRAINEGIISDYKIVGIFIDKEYVEKFNDNKNHHSDNNIKLAKLKALKDVMTKYSVKTGLTFHTTIEASKEFSRLANNSGFGLTIEHIDGSTKHSKRKEIINKLSNNENFLVSNARLLTEGVDTKDIGLVFIDKNMKSKIDTTQLIGRAQRKSKNKLENVGYIVLPLFISDLDSLDDELCKNEDLKNMFDTINTFKHMDSQLQEEIVLRKNNQNAIDEKLWNRNFLEIIGFFNTNNTLPKIGSLNSNERELAYWMIEQKQNADNNFLSWSQTERLSELEPAFKKNVKVIIENANDIFNTTPNKEDRYEYTKRKLSFLDSVEAVILEKRDERDWYIVADEVVEFWKEKGELPKRSEPNSVWIDSQKRSLRKGTLSNERYIYLVNNIPEFFLSRDEKWYETAGEVIDFHKINKQYSTKHNNWIAEQIYKQKPYVRTLSDEKIKYLTDYDKNFFKPSKEKTEENWYKTADTVINFHKEYGRYPGPKELKTLLKEQLTNKQWITSQKQLYKNGTIKKERVDYLLAYDENFFMCSKNNFN